MTAPDSVRDAVGGLLERRGRIDLLVCSHGVVRDGLFAMAPERDWLEVIDANLTGAMRCARAVVRPMMGAGGGACVFVASVAGLRASPGQAGYAASKGGLLALTRTLAAELGPKHIRVNAVVPGLIDAGMVKRMDRRRRDERLAHVPLGRLGEAREVADAVEFLASAGYVTGQALVVDGGLSL
ncbi:MAG: SDR family oxidoreductase [Sandaracinaceae bacterium]